MAGTVDAHQDAAQLRYLRVLKLIGEVLLAVGIGQRSLDLHPERQLRIALLEFRALFVGDLRGGLDLEARGRERRLAHQLLELVESLIAAVDLDVRAVGEAQHLFRVRLGIAERGVDDGGALVLVDCRGDLLRLGLRLAIERASQLVRENRFVRIFVQGVSVSGLGGRAIGCCLAIACAPGCMAM